MQIKLMILFIVVQNVQTKNWYYIKNIRREPSGRYLAIDVDNDIIDCLGAKLIVCPITKGRLSQQWQWQDQMLVNRANNFVIDVKNSVMKKRQPLIVFQPSSSRNQKWTLQGTANGSYLVSIRKKYVIDVDMSGLGTNKVSKISLRGQPLILYKRHATDNQKFVFLKVKNTNTSTLCNTCTPMLRDDYDYVYDNYDNFNDDNFNDDNAINSDAKR